MISLIPKEPARSPVDSHFLCYPKICRHITARTTKRSWYSVLTQFWTVNYSARDNSPLLKSDLILFAFLWCFCQSSSRYRWEVCLPAPPYFFKGTLFGLHPFPIGRLRLSHLNFSLLLKDCWPTQLLTSTIPISGLISRDSNTFPPSTVNTRPLERIPSYVASYSSFQCQCLMPLRLARL